MTKSKKQCKIFIDNISGHYTLRIPKKLLVYSGIFKEKDFESESVNIEVIAYPKMIILTKQEADVYPNMISSRKGGYEKKNLSFQEAIEGIEFMKRKLSYDKDRAPQTFKRRTKQHMRNVKDYHKFLRHKRVYNLLNEQTTTKKNKLEKFKKRLGSPLEKQKDKIKAKIREKEREIRNLNKKIKEKEKLLILFLDDIKNAKDVAKKG